MPDTGGDGNLIGTDGDGIKDYAERNVIGGVALESSHNIVAGDYIGTDAQGTKSLGSREGVSITFSGGYNRIGVNGHDVDPLAERNIISGCSGAGVIIQGPGYNCVSGNYIGTDVTGTQPLGNGSVDVGYVPSGVVIQSVNGNLIGTDSDGVGDVFEGNVISGNVNGGIGGGTSNVIVPNIVVGNFIGTDVTGTQPLGNGLYGVGLGYGAGPNHIVRNIISCNPVGIALNNAHNTLVAGNLIGTDVNGQPIPGAIQGRGIDVAGDTNDQIGGSPALANTIADDGAGVVVGSTSTGISIRANRIFDISYSGIDLGADGVTLNNSHAGQPGPNNWQNNPVLSAAYAGPSSVITGTLNSTPNTTFTLDFYANDADRELAADYREGHYYLGSTTITTDASGNASFTATGLASASLGQWITATATLTTYDPNNNPIYLDTSEFSQDVEVTQALTTTTLTTSASPSLLNQPVIFTASVATATTGLGNPGGSVQFLVDGSNYGSPVPLSGGVATISTSTLSIGPHTIKANYLGDGLFLGSSASLVQAVQYNFGGFLAPLSTGVSYALGRSIPIKFQLSDYSGAVVTSPAAVTGLQIVPVNPGGAAFSPTSTDGKGLTFSGGQFQFNWQTKGLAAGSYQIQLSLADGTTQTKTIQLKAGGGAAGLLADTTGASTAATAGALLGGDLSVAVNDPNGLLTADEQARISDAIARIDQVLAPYGVTMTQVDPSSGPADVTIDTNSTSAVGGYADGVLGCESGTEVTLIQGWNWYAGADPAAIHAGQFDFETVVMHELGHVLGLGHSASATSVMYATLGAGVANRNLAAADLNVPDADGGAPAGLHARASRPVPMPAAASPTPSPNYGLMAWDLAVADLSWSGINRSQRKRT